MKTLSKLSLNQLEVESFVSPTETELSMVKGGATILMSSQPCATLAAAAIASVAAIVVAVINNSSGSGAEEATHSTTPPASTTTTDIHSVYENVQGGDSIVDINTVKVTYP